MGDVAVGGKSDVVGCDVAAGSLDQPFAIACWLDAFCRRESLQVESTAKVRGDQEFLQDVCDEFVGPDASSYAGDYRSLCCGMVVLGQFVLVCDQLHQVSQLWSRLLDNFNVLFGLLEFGVAVDASYTRLRHPLAVNVPVFDLTFESVIVVELEVADLGVVRVFKEDWLAVAAILSASSALCEFNTEM